MNGTPSDDRLSAWLDDELPLAERAEIERQLAESPDMRQEVDELRQVSELVRGLPVEKAPEELQPAAMRNIERDTLLAGESQTASAGSGGRTPSRRQDPRLLVGAVASLLVAAVIMILSGNGAPDPNPVEPPRDIASGSTDPVELKANHPEKKNDDESADDESSKNEGEATNADRQQ